MRTWTVAGLVAVLAACASEPPCDFEKHGYAYETHRLSGTCRGALDPNVIPPGVCTHHYLPVTGMCARSSESVCRAPDGTTIVRQALHREDDDATYSGLVDITLLDAQGGLVCQSSYSVRLDQQ
jgi:hypothetical protein